MKGKICLSEASYFHFSVDSGNSALFLQPFPLLPWKARGDYGESGSRGAGMGFVLCRI